MNVELTGKGFVALSVENTCVKGTNQIWENMITCSSGSH